MAKKTELVETPSAAKDVNEANEAFVAAGRRTPGPGPDDPDAVFDAGNTDDLSDRAGDPVTRPAFAGDPQKTPVESSFASRAKADAKRVGKASDKAVKAADTK